MTLGEVVLNSLPCRDFLFAARWCGPDKEHFAGFASLDCRGEANLKQVEEAMAFSTLITDSIFINFTEDHRYKMLQIVFRSSMHYLCLKSLHLLLDIRGAAFCFLSETNPQRPLFVT
jgi:hypothetical protein